MYRQIQLNSTHTCYRGILFRKKVNEPIQDYELQIVIFGVNFVPYLVIGTPHRVAKDIQDTHPIPSRNSRDIVNADDVLVDVRTVGEAEFVQQRLTTVL